MLALALVAAGLGTLGSAAGGLARTDVQLADASRAVQLRTVEFTDTASEADACTERERKQRRQARPEL